MDFRLGLRRIPQDILSKVGQEMRRKPHRKDKKAIFQA